MSQAIIDPRQGLPSASAAPRVMNCGGSGNLIRVSKLPEHSLATLVRDQGVRIHNAWDTGDLTGLEADEVEGVEALMKLENKAFVQWCEDNGISEPPAKMRETRLWIRNEALKPVMSAQIDVGWVSGHHALIIDGKTGFLDPDPSELSWQLRVQAIALKHEFPEVDSIRVGFAKSRLSRKLDQTDFTARDLMHIEKMIYQGLYEAEQFDAPRRPGTWCKYCPAAGACPEQLAFAQLDVQPAMDIDPVAANWKVSQLSPRAVAEIFKKKKILEVICEAATHRLREMTDEELKAVGLMKSPNTPRRSVVDPVGAFDLLTSTVIDTATNETLPPLFTVPEFVALTSLPIGETVKAIMEKSKKTGGKLTKKDAEEKLMHRIGSAIQANPIAPTIVPYFAALPDAK